jgi:6-phosphofructokinase 2
MMPGIVTLTLNPAVDKSAIVDRVVPEWKLRCASPRYEPGGGGINVSRAIHRLGGESVAFHTAGGPYGQQLQDLLDQEGLDHHAIALEGWTRESFTVYETSTGQQYRFGMPGPNLRDREWNRCLTELSRVDPRPAFIVASGSLPPGVPKDFYGRLTRVARDLGAKMILDTSGEPLVLGLLEGVFLIKPNLREFRELSGNEIRDESECVNLAREIVRTGQSEVVVVSLGAGGAILVWRDGAEYLRAPTVSIKSRVGAGDSMVAGMVLSLARGHPPPEAVRFGVASGAAAVMTPGTELCHRQDAERLYGQMLPGPPDESIGT